MFNIKRIKRLEEEVETLKHKIEETVMSYDTERIIFKQNGFPVVREFKYGFTCTGRPLKSERTVYFESKPNFDFIDETEDVKRFYDTSKREITKPEPKLV